MKRELADGESCQDSGRCSGKFPKQYRQKNIQTDTVLVLQFTELQKCASLMVPLKAAFGTNVALGILYVGRYRSCCFGGWNWLGHYSGYVLPGPATSSNRESQPLVEAVDGVGRINNDDMRLHGPLIAPELQLKISLYTDVVGLGEETRTEYSCPKALPT